MNNIKLQLTTLVLIISLSATSCAFVQKHKGKIGGTLIGCMVGLGLGSMYDHAKNKKAGKKRKDPRNIVNTWFKKRKRSNKGKIVGLAAGCAAGLGVGYYLDKMAEDMEARLKKDNIALRKIKAPNGETEKLYLNMGSDAIEFEANSARFKGKSEARINRLAEAFKGYSDTEIEITGHTSAAKASSFSDKLSADRANAVKDKLLSSGVKSSQIKFAKGLANSKPLPGTSKTNAKNRRVDVYIGAK